jgi:hypothetical protein
MHSVTLAFEAIWKMLLASLVLGAGLPALYGRGIRAMAWGAGGEAEVDETGVTVPRLHPFGKVIGWILVAIVLYGVVCALLFIIATGLGYKVDFTHLIPMFEPK